MHKKVEDECCVSLSRIQQCPVCRSCQPTTCRGGVAGNPVGFSHQDSALMACHTAHLQHTTFSCHVLLYRYCNIDPNTDSNNWVYTSGVRWVGNNCAIDASETSPTDTILVKQSGICNGHELVNRVDRYCKQAPITLQTRFS
jgi:hypothetical protein